MDSPSRGENRNSGNYNSASGRLPPTTNNTKHGLTASSLKKHNQLYDTSHSHGRSGGNRSESGYATNASTKSVAESIISRASARKGKF